MEKLQIKSLSKKYLNDKTATLALNKLNLKIPDKKITVIVGPSGCGKTTLLHLIAGFITPTNGKIILDGKEMCCPTAKVGVVFQEPTLFPWLTVEKNILFGPELNYQQLNPQVLISSVGLSGFEKHYPFMLSLGMQQRAAIARTLAVKPKVLLMDEPFASLDALTREKMQELLLNLHKKTKMPIVFVTHDIEEALLISNTICVMTSRPGKIKAIINNPLPKERSKEIKYSANFLKLRKEIKELLEEEQQGVAL